MSRALVINPNTSAAMTEDIERAAQKVFTPPWSYVVARAPSGPESLESWRDYALAAVDILPLLAGHRNCDGVVLACFGDPGLYSLKELCPVPALGIAEASMSLALLLGGKFGIVAGMDRAVSLMDSLVRTYGLEARYAGTISLSIRVRDFESDRDATHSRLVAACSHLLARGADVVLLGCAGLSGYQDELMRCVPVLVIDPVEAGCRLLKVVVEGGLHTSRGGLFAAPAPQRMSDLDRLFSSEMVELLKKWEE